MVIISAKWVTAKKSHECDRYEIPSDGPCSRTVVPGDRYLRLYGMAHKGDPPYEIRLCTACAERAAANSLELATKLERGRRSA